MNKLRIAFYKAQNGNWDDKLIDRFSGGLGYSHCEVVVNSTTMIGAHYLAKGVAKFRYNDIYSDPMWDIYEIDMDNAQTISYAEFMVGRLGYDTTGVVLYFIGLHMGDDKTDVWCSEFCARAINKGFNPKGVDKLIDNVLTMPNEFYTDFLALGAIKVNKLNARRNRTHKNKPTIDRYGRVAYA